MSDIIRLLQHHFRTIAPAAASALDNSTAELSGNFSLTDPTACSQCPRPDGCDKITMHIGSHTPVLIVRLADAIGEMPQTMRDGLKNCDYLLCDAVENPGSRKVALCDLTCSNSKYLSASQKYPGGKREYVVAQMLSTALFLSMHDVLWHSVQTATSRRFIFGMRVSDEKPTDQAARAMKMFALTPSSAALQTESTQRIANIHFKFVEVRYPSQLNW